MLTLAERLPPRLSRAVTPGRIAVVGQFLRFGCVGLCGFVVDTATVYSLRASVGLYVAGMVSYLIGATVTWSLNRLWTFRDRSHGPMHRQWGLFVIVNLFGFALNRGTYVLLIATTPLTVRYPVLAIFAGAIAGMFVNFALARSVVFRHSPGAEV